MEVRGWALGDGETGSEIKKVEISIDEGITWNEADIFGSKDPN